MAISNTANWLSRGMRESVSGVARLHRYQLDDHLGSSRLEVGGDQSLLDATILCVEAFHPYRTTPWAAADSLLPGRPKRYRYTGMERDSETGLALHGVRYYAPWLAPWTSPDPEGHPTFAYVDGRPIRLVDLDGRKPLLCDGLPDPEFVTNVLKSLPAMLAILSRVVASNDVARGAANIAARRPAPWIVVTAAVVIGIMTISAALPRHSAGLPRHELPPPNPLSNRPSEFRPWTAPVAPPPPLPVVPAPQTSAAVAPAATASHGATQADSAPSSKPSRAVSEAAKTAMAGKESTLLPPPLCTPGIPLGPVYGPLDELGRSTFGAHVSTRASMFGGEKKTLTPPGFNNATDDRGHLVGKAFGGKNLEVNNAAMNWWLNQVVINHQFEGPMRRTLVSDSQATACAIITPAHMPGRVRPIGFVARSVTFSNGGAATNNMWYPNL